VRELEYMPHVDGLRAIAVLAVFLFHLDITFFASGYIGVDIFFVISGYLITRLIVKHSSEDKFSFTEFYTRRARRLFPALFATLSVSLIIGFFILSPKDYENMGSQTLHALLSISNFWFWNNSGYFAAEAKVLPLLHTWSLSVEEQFYLIWPVLVVFLILKFKKTIQYLILLFLFIVSLTGASFLYGYAAEAIFYLMPFRIFEFMIGAALVWLPSNRLSPIISNSLATISLLILVLSLTFFASDSQLQPYYLVIPCIMSAALIYFGKTWVANMILGNQLIVGIGKISYSLYLIHWPVIVFFYYYDLSRFSITDKTAIFAISILLAILSYKYIEQPFRKPKQDRPKLSPSAFGLACAACAGLLAYPASSIWATEGYKWRLPNLNPSLYLVHETVDNTSPQQHAMSAGKGFPRIYGFGSKADDAKRAILIGDSHADQYRDTVDYLGKRHNINFTMSKFPGCPPIFGTYKIYGSTKNTKKQERCKVQIEHWQKLLKAEKFDYVLLASRWAWLFEPTQYGEYNYRRDYLVDAKNPVLDTETSRKIFTEKLAETVDKISSFGSHVIVFSQIPNAGKNITKCNEVPRYIFTKDAINRRCVGVTKKQALNRLSYTNKIIRQLGKKENVTGILPSNYLCRKGQSHCDVIRNNTLIYYDDDHINEFGGIEFAKRWERRKDFPFN